MRSHPGKISGYLASVLAREETPVLACIPLGNAVSAILHAPGMTATDPGLMVRYWEGMDILPEGLIPGRRSGLPGDWLKIDGFDISGGIFIFILRKLCRQLAFKTLNASYLKP